MNSTVARLLRAFGRFWFDFLFGDSVLILPATLGIVGIAFLLRHERAAAVVLVPLLVSAVIALVAFLGRRRSSVRASEQPRD